MKIVIIGAGATGMTVASKLARENKNLEIHIFQNHNYISLGACGIPYFIADDFKNQALLNAKTTKDFATDHYQSKINFHLDHNVTNINPEKNEISYEHQKVSKTINYQYLVIASGAKANIFAPFNQTKAKNLFTVTSKEDAINIKKILTTKKNVVIIGGSFIGLEMTEACLKLQKKVTVVEIQARLMANVFDEEFSDLIFQELTNENNTEKKPKNHENYARILVNTTIKKINLENNVISSLETNTGEKIICDLVLLASGFQANTDFLTTSNIKLAANKAVIINEYGQVLSSNKKTNVYQNIFSGGDCATITNQNTHQTNYLPLATSAIKIARTIAFNITNPNKKITWPGTLGASIIRVKNLELAKVGIKDDHWKNVAHVFVRANNVPKYFSFSKPLFLKLFYDQKTYQLLAAQMAGYHKATLRINALATAIWNKMDVRELQYLDLVYAPPFATTSDIIHIAARKIK